MVARIRPEGELVVIFSGDGETDDARIVADGHRAGPQAQLTSPRNPFGPRRQLIDAA
jgi:hypothetical protein